MAFGNFKKVEDVAKMFQINVQVGPFLLPLPMPVSDYLREDLDFSLANLPVRASEASICEYLILPVLREVWKRYRDSLLLWSHASFGAEEPLVGTPDYYFARQSPLGLVSDQPYVLVVEAKKDDFDTGWAQCLAAMLAAQKMHDSPRRIIHGCVSNGSGWEFAKLDGQQYLRDPHTVSLSPLSDLFAVWNHVLSQAREQALAPAA